ncbi:hypothetical protein CLAIMM_14713 [Cladophialophora immunda]|nr:hypothetical protein CLAIMM_14713 [Cladophialophora immunda]
MCNFLGRALDAQRFFHDVTYESSKVTWAIAVYAVLPEERLDQSNFRNNTPSNTNIWRRRSRSKVQPSTQTPLLVLLDKTRVVPCKISKERFAEGLLSALSAPRPQRGLNGLAWAPVRQILVDSPATVSLALDPAAANGFVTVIVDTIIVALVGIKLFHIYERYAFIPQILGQKLPKNRGYLKKGGHEFRVAPEMRHLYGAGGGRDLHKLIFQGTKATWITVALMLAREKTSTSPGRRKAWVAVITFQNVVMPIANEFDPDFVIIAGSFDAAADDELQITALHGP